MKSGALLAKKGGLKLSFFREGGTVGPECQFLEISRYFAEGKKADFFLARLDGYCNMDVETLKS